MNYSKIRNFSKDSAIEKKIAEFLDANFYSQISSDNRLIYRTNELSEQYSGIDLSVGNWLVDEKSKNTSTPNEIKNYYCSIELYHKQRNGNYTKGWFFNDNQKTTHYFFEYRFEDAVNEISSVILVCFSKNAMKEYLDDEIGLNKLDNDASDMEYKIKGIDDIIYRNKAGYKIGKLTKSYEGACVLAFNLTDLEKVEGSGIIEVVRNKKPRRMSFKELKSRFN